MGITTVSLNILDQTLARLGIGYAGPPALRILELGNQYLYLDPEPGGGGIPHLTVAKEFFQRRGARHTSVDINGKDGALPLDLCMPLEDWPELPIANCKLQIADFDLVTNFGTLEHVADVYEGLRNVHRFAKPDGGLIAHVWPASGHWPGHGFHYATEQTVEQLAALCGYRIEYLKRWPSMGNSIDGWQVHAVLVQGESRAFPSRDEFARRVPMFPA